MSEDLGKAAQLAAIAASVGAGARVMLALHSGVRRIGLLAIEGGVGACLGIIVAGGIAYWHPEMWHAEQSVLVVAGGAGMAGAIGTRLLDIIVAFAQRKAAG